MSSNSSIKDKLYKELEMKNKIGIEEVNVNPEIFKYIDLGGKYQEQVHVLFEQDHETHASFDLPCGYTSLSGIRYAFKWDRRSSYSIEYENDKYYLTHK